MLGRLARFFLAVALLAGWQAALVHPLEHSDERGRLVHLQDGQPDGHGSETGELCDALAALGNLAPGATPQAVVEDTAELFKASVQPAARLAEAPPFLSQGPPALL